MIYEKEKNIIIDYKEFLQMKDYIEELEKDINTQSVSINELNDQVAKFEKNLYYIRNDYEYKVYYMPKNEFTNDLLNHFRKIQDKNIDLVSKNDKLTHEIYLLKEEIKNITIFIKKDNFINRTIKGFIETWKLIFWN